MNIGIDIRPLMHPVRTGVGEYTYELLNAIFELDKTNQYFLFYNSQKNISKNLPKWNGDNIHYTHTAWPNKVFNVCIKLFGWPKLDKIIIKKCKLKIENSQLDWFYSPNLNFTSLSKNTKHLITIHDLSFEFFPEFYTKKRQLWHKIINYKKQCQKATKIIVPSENTKRDLVDKYKIPAEKIQIIYPGLSSVFKNLDIENVRRQQMQIKKKYFLPENFMLFLGTIEPRKNIVGIIKSFEKIYPLLPADYSLVIAGTPGWKNKKIYAAAHQSAVREQIKFIGYIAPEDKPALYASTNLFVYPSFYEGFGFPVLEAMAMGIPVITSDRSSLPELASQASTLVNPNKINEITQAMKEILTNTAQRSNQIKNGLSVVTKFSWDRAAREWLSQLSS